MYSPSVFTFEVVVVRGALFGAWCSMIGDCLLSCVEVCCCVSFDVRCLMFHVCSYAVC